MQIREGLYYSKDHEWVKVEGEKAYIGITDYAQSQLGDIVFVELPAVDDEVSAGDRLAVVESVKAVADVHSPVSGRVLEINTDLEDSPEGINEDAFGSFIAVIELTDASELKGLMSANEYSEFVKEA